MRYRWAGLLGVLCACRPAPIGEPTNTGEHDGATPSTATTQSSPEPVFVDASVDRHGAPLPAGAVARLGSPQPLRRRLETQLDEDAERERWEDAGSDLLEETSDPHSGQSGRFLDVVTESDDGRHAVVTYDIDGVRAYIGSLDRDEDTGETFADVGPRLRPPDRRSPWRFQDAIFDGDRVLAWWVVDERVALVVTTRTGKRGGTFMVSADDELSPTRLGIVHRGPSGPEVLLLPRLRRSLPLSGLAGPVRWAAAASDADVLVLETLEADGPVVTLWDMPARTLRARHKRSCARVAIDADASRLACTGQPSDDGAVVSILDARTGAVEYSMPDVGRYSGVEFSPDGARLIATGAERTFVLEWDLARRTSPSLERGHTGAVTGVALSADGERAASVDTDANLHLWDLRTSQTRWRRTVPLPETYERVAFVGSGRAVVTPGGQDCGVLMFNADDGERRECLGSGSFEPTDIAVTGSWIVWMHRGEPKLHVQDEHGSSSTMTVHPTGQGPVGLPHGRVSVGNQIYDLAKGEQIGQLDGLGTTRGHAELTPSPGVIRGALDEQTLVLQTSTDIQVVDISGAPQATLAECIGKPGRCYGVVSSPEHGLVAVARADGVEVYDREGARRAAFEDDSQGPSLAIHPKEPVVLTTSSTTVLAWLVPDR